MSFMLVRFNLRHFPPPIGGRRLLVPVGIIVLALDLVPSDALAQLPQGEMLTPAEALKQVAPDRKPTPKGETTIRPGSLQKVTRLNLVVDSARAAQKSGNCKKALEYFDLALRTAQAPSVVRDRGACHEALGNREAAIADYKRYLVEATTAKDADAVRTKMESLEGYDSSTQSGKGSEGGSTTSSESGDKRSEKVDGSVRTDGEGAEVRLSASGNASSASGGSSQNGGNPDASRLTLRELAEREGAERSALRLGSGIVLAPYFGVRRALGSGVSEDFGFQVGLGLRYAFGPVLSVIGEVGYAGFGTGGKTGRLGGVQTFLGLEARVPLDRLATNQIYFHFGPGYERLSVAAVANIRFAQNVLFLPRARVGYRHVFGPALALEVAADGGLFYGFISNLPSGVASSNEGKFYGMLGGNLSVAAAF
jgi:tetratricopeptide (TPR) repeat protein